MRRTGVVVLVAFVAGCSSSGHQSPSATQAGLKSAVTAYTAALLNGKADQAFALVSQRCQVKVGHDSFVNDDRTISNAYKGLTLQTYRVDTFNPPSATVSYGVGPKVLNRSHQHWVFSGGWKWDGC